MAPYAYILTGSSVQVSRAGIMADFSSITLASGGDVISAYPHWYMVVTSLSILVLHHRWSTPLLQALDNKHSITRVHLSVSDLN